MDIDRLLLVSKFKRSSILAKYIGKFFFIVKTKSSLSPFIFIIPTISQILKTKFYAFFKGKHRETGPNFLHELATFFKYHMSKYIFENLFYLHS